MSTDLSWGVAYAVAVGVLVLVIVAVKPLRSLTMGADNRVSTSKLQFWAWTLAVIFALLVLLVAWGLDQLGWTDGPVGDAFETFRTQGLDETYLLLLGLPAGAAIGAKAITTTKMTNGTIVKTDKPDSDTAEANPDEADTNALQEVVSDDTGSGDLGDAQYFLFNLVALGYFLIQFLTTPADGLPVMPDTLVGLTGVAAAAYVAKKGVYREPPILLSLDPPAQRPGQRITVHGDRLTGAQPDKHPTTVVFGVQPAVLEQDEDGCTVVVPETLEPGAVKVRVVRPPGAESERLDFTVLDPRPVVGPVRPSRIVIGTDSELVIEGRQFLSGQDAASDSNAVLLDGRPLTTSPGDWSDVRVRVTLPMSDAEIALAQIDEGTFDLVVVGANGHASEPKSIAVKTTRPLPTVEGPPAGVPA